MGVTELHGRDRELETLTGAADAARHGSGSTVLIHGEAGIGKTRLIDEISVYAERVGMRVCRGRSEELEQGQPFGALVEALGVPDALPPASASMLRGEQRFVVQDAFVEHVDHLGHECPTVVAVDDLQWGDPATLSTLWALARRANDLGILLVLAYRPTPQPVELMQIVDRCHTVDAVDLALGPVTDDAIAEIAGDVAGSGAVRGEVLAQLRTTGGNPFVVIELASAFDSGAPLGELADVEAEAAEVLPDALRSSLLHRLTAVAPATREMLAIAAVLDGSGRLEDLAAMLGISVTDAARAVSEATRAGLLEPDTPEVAFRHDLIRQAVYEDLPEAVRARWHRESAARLSSWAEPTVVAQHLMLGATAGDEASIGALRSAAADLGDATPSMAAAVLERALALTRDDAEHFELAVERAQMLFDAGRAEDAEDQAVRALAGPGGSAQLRARAQHLRARSLSRQGRFGESRVGLQEALATGALDPRDRAIALGECAQNCAFTIALDEALAFADAAILSATPLHLTDAIIDAQLARCMVHVFRSEFAESIAAGEAAIALAEADPRASTNNTVFAMALAGCDRPDAARDVVETGRRRAIERSDSFALASQQATLGWLLWSVGEWDAAVAEIDVAATLAEDFGLFVSDQLGRSVLANIAFHRGDLDAARAGLEASRGEEHRGGLAPRNLWARLEALLREAEGDVDGAAAFMLELFGLGNVLGISVVRNMLGVECARLAAAAGDDGAVESMASDFAAFAVSVGTPSARGAAAYTRGLLDRDGATLSTAAQEFAGAKRPYVALRALEGAGDAFASAGARDQAVTSLREAFAIASNLGATHDVRRIGSALRALGVRVGSRSRSPRPRFGWDALTATEREVAVLVADGLRNLDIAERLFVSRRTVEAHVARLYEKLEVKSRVALAGVIAGHLTPSASAGSATTQGRGPTTT